ncbi:hypothetical protein ABQZ69_19135 [Xanthomonas sp. WHRI 8391]|uniref:hypothetical protein n=1 Tax=Xanthomonas TaxID=338 RepID=UPI001A333B0B|nr:hypothetical protein [Xanthomonas hortorum]MBG3850384.1 hypothetical protein [Xanthomonas hortorum pv. carotae]UTS72251.1 hypothetical protein NMB96_17415 [Xanthomonas hortorum]
MTGLIAFSLLGVACFVCSIGTARLVGWILDRRDAAILRQLREEDLIASANHHVRIARIKRSVRAAAEREVDHA